MVAQSTGMPYIEGECPLSQEFSPGWSFPILPSKSDNQLSFYTLHISEGNSLLEGLL